MELCLGLNLVKLHFDSPDNALIGFQRREALGTNFLTAGVEYRRLQIEKAEVVKLC